MLYSCFLTYNRFKLKKKLSAPITQGTTLIFFEGAAKFSFLAEGAVTLKRLPYTDLRGRTFAVIKLFAEIRYRFVCLGQLLTSSTSLY